MTIAMQFPRQLAQLAQQRALSSFADLTGHMLSEADASMAQASRTVAGDEQAALSSARSLVRYDGHALRTRMQEQFALLLERAMQTMHTDLRGDFGAVSIDQLSLMDDAVMDRQILVDRLLVRLRDVDQLGLGRLNMIIAQLHGVSEVRERENPFRPWLLARALYEAVSGMVHDELRIRILFQHLSAGIAAHLPDYYGAVLEVFEQRGVVGRLSATPSQMTRAERERLAWQRAAQEAARQPVGAAPAGVTSAARAEGSAPDAAPGGSALLPALRRMLSGAPRTASAFPDLDGIGDAEELRALVRRIGARGRGAVPSAATPAAAASASAAAAAAAVAPLATAAAQRAPGPQLLAALRGAQQASMDGADAGAPLRLAQGLAQAPGVGAERAELQHIDLVALLFEFMLEDGLLDGPARVHVARLFVPFLRVALSEPELPLHAGHPARRLLDRIGQLAAAIQPGVWRDLPQRAPLLDAIAYAVDRVLRKSDGSAAVFGEALDGLNGAVARLLRDADPRLPACLAALAEARAAHARVGAVGEAVESLLSPLLADPSVAGFIRTHWVRVMAAGAPGETGHAGLLAELVWSAQAKLDPAEHAALMRLLPGLVKRVREGLARLALPEAETRAALDTLVAVHMDVMANRQDPAAGALDLESLRRYFAPLERQAHGQADGPGWPTSAELAPALARHAAVATVAAEPALDDPGQPDDDATLAVLQPGVGVEFLEGGIYVPGMLVAAGGAFVFAVPGAAAPVLYTRAALLRAMRDESLRTLEYAPLFERAIDRLSVSAEALMA